MTLRAISLASLALLATSSAFAVPAGSWSVGVGAAYVDPQSDASPLAGGDLQATVDEDVKPSLTLEYFPMNNVGVEVLAAWPFEHDINLNGQYAGKTKHLPPTVSVNYHFDGLNSRIKPFVGVGVNYTTFWGERLYAVPDASLELDDSVGVAGNVGVDFKLNATDALRLNARYIDLKTDATVTVNGQSTNLGEVDISPWVYGVSYVKSF